MNERARVIWFSRHTPLPSQIEALRRLYGEEVEVVRDSNPFANAADLAARYRASGATDLVAVAPLSVIQRLCEQGLRPLRAEFIACPPDQVEITNPRAGHLRFDRFVRVNGLTLNTEEVG